MFSNLADGEKPSIGTTNDHSVTKLPRRASKMLLRQKGRQRRRETQTKKRGGYYGGMARDWGVRRRRSLLKRRVRTRDAPTWIYVPRNIEGSRLAPPPAFEPAHNSTRTVLFPFSSQHSSAPNLHQFSSCRSSCRRHSHLTSLTCVDYSPSSTMISLTFQVRAVASPTDNVVLSASRDSTAIAWIKDSTHSFSPASVFRAGERFVNSVTHLPPTAEAPHGERLHHSRLIHGIE